MAADFGGSARHDRRDLLCSHRCSSASGGHVDLSLTESQTRHRGEASVARLCVRSGALGCRRSWQVALEATRSEAVCLTYRSREPVKREIARAPSARFRAIGMPSQPRDDDLCLRTRSSTQSGVALLDPTENGALFVGKRSPLEHGKSPSEGATGATQRFSEREPSGGSLLSCAAYQATTNHLTHPSGREGHVGMGIADRSANSTWPEACSTGSRWIASGGLPVVARARSAEFRGSRLSWDGPERRARRIRGLFAD